MTLARRDLRKLRQSLAAALLMLTCGAAALIVSERQVDTATREQGEAKAQLHDISSRLQRVRDEEQEIHRQSALFAALQRRGTIGGEERLDWIETLRDLRNRRQPAEMEYEFAPRQPLGSAGTYVFYRSTMTLRLKLVHDGELFELLADLRGKARALVAVRHCQVQRLTVPTADPTGGGAPVHLEASCLIDWITAQEGSA